MNTMDMHKITERRLLASHIKRTGKRDSRSLYHLLLCLLFKKSPSFLAKKMIPTSLEAREGYNFFAAIRIVVNKKIDNFQLLQRRWELL